MLGAMTHVLQDNGDGTGEYRGWKLTKKPCESGCSCGAPKWYTSPPYELLDLGRGIWESVPGNTWTGPLFARHVDGWNLYRTPTIASVIDLFEAARERLMAAAFTQDGPDDSDRLVRIER